MDETYDDIKYHMTNDFDLTAANYHNDHQLVVVDILQSNIEVVKSRQFTTKTFQIKKKLQSNNNNNNNNNANKSSSSTNNHNNSNNNNNNNNNNKNKISCRIYECLPKCTRGNNESSESSSISLALPSINDSMSIPAEHYGNYSNSKNIMDRSVDSIGSCSLDVDAESADFSDTSGSLNLCTPLSGKDFTREFTSRIQERCQFGQTLNRQNSNQQQQQPSASVFDPNSGKIQTILANNILTVDPSSSTSTTTTSSSSSQSVTNSRATTNGIDHPVTSSKHKKPSYLKLACCVNGYSNLTNYNSKLRQNINKSREVSPIHRPIQSQTIQYNNTDGNFLIVPIPIRNSTTINNNSSSETSDITTFLKEYNLKNSAIQNTNATMNTTNNQHEQVITTSKNSTERYFTQKIIDIQQKKNSGNYVSAAAAATASIGTDTIDNFQHISMDNNMIYKTNIMEKKLSGNNSTGSPLKTVITTTNIFSINKLSQQPPPPPPSKTTTTTSQWTTPTKLLNDDIESLRNDTTTKSFIQQRVERLYGPGALAQGFYSPKRNKVNDKKIMNNTTEQQNSSNLLTQNNHHSTTTQRFNTIVTSQQHHFHKSNYQNININNNNSNGSSNEFTMAIGGASSMTDPQNNNFNNECLLNRDDMTSLPVLRHLRPEFRAQLPILSPKRTPKTKLLSNTNDHDNDNDNDDDDNNDKDYANNKITINDDTNLSFTAAGDGFLNESKEKQQYANGKKQSSTFHTNGNLNIILANSPIQILNELPIPLPIPMTPLQSSQYLLLSNNNNNSDKISAQIESMNGSLEPPPSTKQPILTDEITNSLSKMKLIADTSSASPIITATASKEHQQQQSDVVINSDTENDGHYFLKILSIERNRLIELANKTEYEMELLLNNKKIEVDEDIFGYLRAASGKAKLLASQKIQQFEGLCYKSINQLPGDELPCKPGDLQGFWDMVMLQVNDVDNLFMELETIKANNWKKPEVKKPLPPQGAKLTKRPITKRITSANPSITQSTTTTVAQHNENGDKTTTNGMTTSGKQQTAAAAAATEKRETQRKQLMELKRKLKQQHQQTNAAAVIATGTSTATDHNFDNNIEMFINEPTSTTNR